MKKYLLSLALLFSFVCLSQISKEDKILSFYDLNSLKSLEFELQSKADIDFKKALSIAEKSNKPVRILHDDGSVEELVGLFPDGTLKYYKTDNTNAATTTRTNFVNNLGFDGQGFFVGVWDGGAVRVSHQEFTGRASVFDGSSANPAITHATHVAGTIGAAGVTSSAKGMANKVQIRSFDWFNDASEVVSQVQQGMLISNHSYGVPIANAPGSWFMGAYTNVSRAWDQIAYNAPFYLQVVSAGNDGNTPNPNPSTPGFDKLNENKNSKNNLVVANAQQAQIDASGNLISVSINSGSSQGPTDDRRIKPDIAGQGTSLFSASAASNSSYTTLSGTSMAAPNVAGTLILLQEQYFQKFSRFMKSATLKGLVCHTADDAGPVGPDPIFGWGLLNAKRASESIIFNGLSSLILEDNLSNGQTKTYSVSSSGDTPLKASITWTDLPGVANNGQLNDATPRLVNDLDIRVTKDGDVYFPWRLQNNASLPATRNSDNNVDNVEIVLIDNPSPGDYTITISHKGTLVSNAQDFSLVVTGLNSTFSVLPINNREVVCQNQEAIFNFDFTNLDFDSVSLSVLNVPNNASFELSQSSLLFNQPFTLTIANLQNVPSGVYEITVVGSKNGLERTAVVELEVKSNQFDEIIPVFPIDNQQNVAPSSMLSWNPESNSESYRIQLSNSSNFSNLLVDEVVEVAEYPITGLSQGQTYFWRIFPANQCVVSTTATIFSFSTAELLCNENYSATNFSNAIISSSAFASASVSINVGSNFLIGDLTANFTISHPATQELRIVLRGPSSLGSPEFVLIDQSCGQNPNINVSVNDNFGVINCSNSSPSISGSIKPLDSFHPLYNKSAIGTWTLLVYDDFFENGGQIQSFNLAFCKVLNDLNVISSSLNTLNVWPNPSKDIVNIDLGKKSNDLTVKLIDMQGRVVISKFFKDKESVEFDVSFLPNGVYLLSVKDEENSYTKKLVIQ